MFNFIPQQWLIYGVIGLAIISGFLFLMWRNESLSSENKQLTQQVSSLQAEVKYKDEMNQKISTQMDTLLKTQTKRQKETQVIRERIIQTPSDKNGEVAPVLQDTLTFLRAREEQKGK